MTKLPVQPSDPQPIDLLLQFILLVAGQQDELRDRELGPIHLLKYAYLADLAYAEAHAGEIFTGVAWQFHDFGPWSPTVFERIEPALAAANAERKQISGAHGDFVRYRVYDDALLDRLDRKLPQPVVGAVRRAVRAFGSDTASLLRHVYMTPPMLRAAPRDTLVFGQPSETTPHAPPLPPGGAVVAFEVSPRDAAKVAAREEKQRRKIADQLRERVRARLAERRAHAVVPAAPPPRYDKVFFEGTEWLDQQAGDPMPLSEGELVFSPDIWKSRGRSESDEDGS